VPKILAAWKVFLPPKILAANGLSEVLKKS